MSRTDPGELAGPGQERAPVTAEQEAPVAGRRSRTRLVVQGVLSLVLVVAIFYLGPAGDLEPLHLCVRLDGGDPGAGLR
jgi:hypothetical protein